MPTLCPSLPSAEVAYDLVKPDIAALPAVLGTVAFRGVLIWMGLKLAHFKDDEPPSLALNALIASGVVEVFVLGWATYQTHKANTAAVIGMTARSVCWRCHHRWTPTSKFQPCPQCGALGNRNNPSP